MGNAGYDCTDLLNKLRYEHNAKNDANCGIDIDTGGVCDTWAKFVWEPSLVKRNALLQQQRQRVWSSQLTRQLKSQRARKTMSSLAPQAVSLECKADHGG